MCCQRFLCWQPVIRVLVKDAWYYRQVRKNQFSELKLKSWLLVCLHKRIALRRIILKIKKKACYSLIWNTDLQEMCSVLFFYFFVFSIHENQIYHYVHYFCALEYRKFNLWNISGFNWCKELFVIHVSALLLIWGGGIGIYITNCKKICKKNCKTLHNKKNGLASAFSDYFVCEKWFSFDLWGFVGATQKYILILLARLAFNAEACP